MSRSLNSRDYFVKCLCFVLLFVFISLGAIGGCGNNGGEQDGTQALTERDFFNNLNLFANPEEGVVVVFLESAESPEAVNLTGELGFDVIPLRYARTLNHTFCFEDDNDDSVHFMILRDSDGEEVLMVQANGDCVTVIIEAGDYEMVLTHGEHVDEQETIFLIPVLDEEQVTKRDEFNQREIKTANGFSYKMNRYLPGGLIKYFERISNVFTRRARAQTGGDPFDNITTLLNTNACVGCNLTGLDLTGADLSWVNLEFADLTEVELSGANLTGANLTGVTIDLTFFGEALWCDGDCTCSGNSINTCAGCASIDTCTASNACNVAHNQAVDTCVSANAPAVTACFMDEQEQCFNNNAALISSGSCTTITIGCLLMPSPFTCPPSIGHFVCCPDPNHETAFLNCNIQGLDDCLACTEQPQLCDDLSTDDCEKQTSDGCTEDSAPELSDCLAAASRSTSM